MSSKSTPAYKNPSLPVEQRVEDLLSRLTLEEKVGQLDQKWCGWNAFKIKGEEIELVEEFAQVLRRGGAGALYGIHRSSVWTVRDDPALLTPRLGARAANVVQKFAIENHRLGIPLMFSEECSKGHQTLGSTVFPAPILYASSWDREMIREMARIVALETRVEGAHLGYGPILDVPHDPRWSRVEETMGEDPYLTSQLGVEMVRGKQGQGRFDNSETVMSTLKHYAGYGTTEGGRHAAPTHAGRREMLEMFLPAFEAAVKAGAESVMCSYNEVDGVPVACNHWLLTEMLREQWGFTGFVVADAISIDELHIKHKVAPGFQEACTMAIQAGLDMSLWDQAFDHLAAAVCSGKLSMAILDQAVRRVLRAKFLLGLFENPYADEERAAEIVGCRKHRDYAVEVARRSIILLKNENDTLPLAGSARRIAVIGPNADNLGNMIGNYTPDVYDTPVTILEGIRRQAPAGTAVKYALGCRVKDPSKDGFAEAVALARESDVVVMVVGGSSRQDKTVKINAAGAAVVSASSALSDIDCGEGMDRSDIELSGVQMDLVKEVHATGKPMVVVLVQGRPHSIPWIAENISAILCAWYPGPEGGLAVADILFGRANPAGKLTISVPKTTGQIPVNYNHKPSAEKNYVLCDTKPLYPFGFGLSYTSWKYANLRVSPERIGPDGQAKVSVEVTNAGKREGEEIVQLYIRDDYSTTTRPVKELKGFERVCLAPGETKTVTFTLGPEHLSFVGMNMERTVEPGSFTIMAGGNSLDTLTARLEVVL